MPLKFAGFSPQGIQFLKSLKKNNNREWFQARKETFDQQIKAPMEELVQAVNSHLMDFAPMFVTEPKKAIYRIYRDTRFSNDKTPYKTHVAASLTRAGMEKHISAGYYFSIGAEEMEVAGGIYMPGPDQLRAIREHLLEHHEEFRKIVSNPSLKKLMGGLYGKPMARMPKGFPQDHPAGEFIRARHWIFYDTRLDPKLAVTPKLLGELMKRFRAMTPFLDFLNRPLAVKAVKDPLRMRM